MTQVTQQDTGGLRRPNFKYWFVPTVCGALFSLTLMLSGSVLIYRLFLTEVIDPVVLRDFPIFVVAAIGLFVNGLVNLMTTYLWKNRPIAALIWQVLLAVLAIAIVLLLQHRANIPFDNSHIPNHIRTFGHD